MNKKYHLGLAPFITTIALFSFAAGVLVMTWISENNKSTNEQQYKELMSFYEKAQIFPDLNRVRSTLRILMFVESKEALDRDEMASIYRKLLVKDRTLIAQRIGTMPAADWEVEAKKLNQEIDDYLFSK